MTDAARIEWQTGKVAQQAGQQHAMALIVSLDDPAMAPLWSLAPSERDLREISYPGASSRERFLERRALLRSMVAARSGWPLEEVVIGYDDAGAPVVLSPPDALYVSMAGRDDFAAAAIASRPVGIDIELLDSAVEPVDVALHHNELAELAVCDADSRAIRFLRIWTMKEAYLKALRTGFKRDPATIEITALDAESATIADGAQPVNCTAQWTSGTIGGRRVIAACVVLEKMASA